jgi:hypothetical protein
MKEIRALSVAGFGEGRQAKAVALTSDEGWSDFVGPGETQPVFVAESNGSYLAGPACSTKLEDAERRAAYSSRIWSSSGGRMGLLR